MSKNKTSSMEDTQLLSSANTQDDDSFITVENARVSVAIDEIESAERQHKDVTKLKEKAKVLKAGKQSEVFEENEALIVTFIDTAAEAFMGETRSEVYKEKEVISEKIKDEAVELSKVHAEKKAISEIIKENPLISILEKKERKKAAAHQATKKELRADSMETIAAETLIDKVYDSLIAAESELRVYSEVLSIKTKKNEDLAAEKAARKIAKTYGVMAELVEKNSAMKGVLKATLVIAKESLRVSLSSDKDDPKKQREESKNVPSEKNLLKFLGKNLKHCNQSELSKKSISFSGMSKKFSKKIFFSLTDILCIHCSLIKVPIKLECGHSTCRNCFKKSITKLCKETTFEAQLRHYRKCSCRQCSKNFSLADIKNYTQDQLYILLSLRNSCKRCKLDLPLFTHYWAECTCLDLCCNCYIDCQTENLSVCPYCYLKFSNQETSSNRFAICQKCEKKLPLLNKCRIDSNNRTLCLECISKHGTENELIQNNSINRICAECRCEINIFNTFTTSCCKVPICITCQTLICVNCSQKVTNSSVNTNNCCKAFVSTFSKSTHPCTYCSI